MLESELDSQDDVARAIYFVPTANEVMAHYVFDYTGIGPKSYLNLWITNEPPNLTWSWIMHESAILLWKQKKES